MIIKCKRCGELFLGKNRKLYCSIKCRGKYWSEHNKERIKFICECCGKTFGRSRRYFGGKKIKYCSRYCANKVNGRLLVKEKTRHKTQGYISIWNPDHPHNHFGRIREHILVMEKIIGRYLVKGEIVHHINYLEDDNRERNLYLCHIDKNHYKIHKLSRYLLKEFIREKKLGEELTEYIIKNCSIFKEEVN